MLLALYHFFLFKGLKKWKKKWYFLLDKNEITIEGIEGYCPCITYLEINKQKVNEVEMSQF